MMFQVLINEVKAKKPLIHNITNYVTVNDCANILLACGASPIMADEIKEVAEITSLCAGLNLNIGTLNQRTIEAMLVAGQQANQLNLPVVLDPVGVGASSLRNQTAQRLLDTLHFTVIKGNISEIKALALKSQTTQGVDAATLDLVTKENLHEVVAFAKKYAQALQTILVITGPIDLVVDANRAFAVYNGHSMMAKITGTGCMLNALITAYLASYPQDYLLATLNAVCLMGLAGELAAKRLQPFEGNASFRTYLIDAVDLMTPEVLAGGIRYEEIE